MRHPSIELADKTLLVCLPGPHRTLSWALAGGGFHETHEVVWREVRNQDLSPDVDPVALLRADLKRLGRCGALGLMTSAPLSDYTQAVAQVDDVTASCVATVGLSNALAVGDLPSAHPTVGTINLLIWLSTGLTDSALVEALSIATEARTVAVTALAVKSRASERIATGTGTDCVAVAAPVDAQALAYAGKHTAVGSAVGQCVQIAMQEGLSKWEKRKQA